LVVGLSHRDESNPDATDDGAKILVGRAFPEPTKGLAYAENRIVVILAPRRSRVCEA